MGLISFGFLAFVLIGLFCYFVAPDRHKWKVLLAESLLYYLLICNKYIVFLLITILSTYLGTRLIEQQYARMNEQLKANKEIWDRKERKAYRHKMERMAKYIMFTVLFINFGILLFIKYTGSMLGILIPLGISFYTFQAMGYVIDVYLEKVPVEKNLAKVALFTSFFPQIIQGPIAMYSDLADQLYVPHKFDLERIKRAFLLVLWGLFKKLVIADRAVQLINHVTADSQAFCGTFLLLTTLVYALQLYADFSGGIDIVRGIGEMYGIQMAENFRRPYFSKSLAEYWHRWHITLGNWVRTYVFYPLSISKTFINFGKWINKKGNRHLAKVVPTSLASVITFVVIGMWHGSNGKYLAFGLWNGLMIMVIELIDPITQKVKAKLQVREDSRLFGGICMIWTFLLVLVGYYFDIAQNFLDGISMMVRSVTEFSLADLAGLSGLLNDSGLDLADFALLIAATVVLVSVSMIQEQKKIEIRDWIRSRSLPLRWGIIYAGIFLVLILGYYGPDVNPSDFIYMQF